MHGHLAFLGLFWEVLLSDDCSDDSASVSEKGIARGDTPGDIPVRLRMDTCNKLGFSVGVVAKVECRTVHLSCPPQSCLCYVFPYWAVSRP